MNRGCKVTNLTFPPFFFGVGVETNPIGVECETSKAQAADLCCQLEDLGSLGPGGSGEWGPPRPRLQEAPRSLG